MDFNDLYYRHQLSLMHAAAAATPEARSTHLGRADRYASQINGASAGRPDGSPQRYLLRSARSILSLAVRLRRAR